MKDLIQSDTTAKVVTAVTSGTGISTLAGIIPDILGCVASTIGIVISVAIWRKLELEKRKLKIEIEILEGRRGGGK